MSFEPINKATEEYVSELYARFIGFRLRKFKPIKELTARDLEDPKVLNILDKTKNDFMVWHAEMSVFGRRAKNRTGRMKRPYHTM